MKYDALVMGGGPAGYKAAYELACNGIKIAIVDLSEERLGGTCLNEGCIPVKTLLESAHILERLKNPAFGIFAGDVKIDISTLRQTVEENKRRLRQGILYLLKSKGVEFVRGKAAFESERVVSVENGNGENFKIEAEKFIIATGSIPKDLKSFPVDGNIILNSKQILDEKNVPSSLLIVGGGAIGCEFASFYNAIGTRVTLIEMMTQLLPGEDEEVSRTLKREMEKKGITIFTESILKGVDENGGEANAILLLGGKELKQKFEKILIATGRKPNVEGLELENAGIETEGGFIKVNHSFQTTNPSIYAAGDVINTLMLAHVAYREGVLSALACIGKKIETDYLEITPRIVYTLPQVASAGLTEKKAIEKGIDLRVTKAFFRANGKAVIEKEDSGFLKLLWNKKQDIIVGASIIGPSASELIHIVAIAIREKMKSEEVKNIVFGHPTLAEIFGEAVGLG